MSSRRINLSIDERVHAIALKLMKRRVFNDFSGFISQLIRDEYERQGGPAMPLGDSLMNNEPPPAFKTASDDPVPLKPATAVFAAGHIGEGKKVRKRDNPNTR